MRVYVLGSGAIGTLYGTALVKGGNDVVFLDGWQQLLDAMKAHPVAHLTPIKGQPEDIPVKVMSYAEAPNVAGDLIIVTVKSTMTKPVMEGISHSGIIGPNTIVVTFQGGFENPEIISKFLPEKTNCLPAYVTSFSKSAGMMKIENFGINPGSLWPLGLGSHEKPSQRVSEIVDGMNASGLSFELTPRAVADRWRLILYYPTNIAVSAILSLNFGTCWETAECRELLTNLAKECALIAKLDGIDPELFNENIAIEDVKKLAMDDPSHAGSMLQDIKNKRITEIDGNAGALLRRAAFHHIDLPYTRCIHAFIRTRESNYGKEV